MEKSIKITNLSFLHFVISLNPLSFHNKVCVLFVFQQKLVHPGSSPTSFQQFLRAIQKLPQDTVLNKCLKKKVFLNFLGCVWWCVCVCVLATCVLVVFVCVGNTITPQDLKPRFQELFLKLPVQRLVQGPAPSRR